MRWHVICYLWLMLSIHASCNQTLKAPELRRSVRLDEVSDFADVIEPLHNQADSGVEKEEALGPTRRDVKSSIFKRHSYDFNSDNMPNNFNGDASIQTRLNRADDVYTELNNKNENDDDPSSLSTKHNVPKKYSNLLDLKYYYARGLPLNKKYPRFRKRSANVLGDAKEESKRSAVNILPVMSDQNPYMSKLADATNDAYLKMRNYAATLMVILTTPKAPIAHRRLETEAVYSTTPNVPRSKFFKKNKFKFNRFNSFAGVNGNNNDRKLIGEKPRPMGSGSFPKRKMFQDFKKKKSKTKPGGTYYEMIQNDVDPTTIDDPAKFEKLKKDVPFALEDSNFKFYRQPQRGNDLEVTQFQNLLNTGAGTPYSWENNILDEVNVKVKKEARLPKAAKSDEEAALEKEGKSGDHVNVTKSEKQTSLELESKVISGETNTSETASCTINKLPESEEDNCEDSEEEEDEECPSNLPANSACLDTFEKLNRTKRQIEKEVTNTSRTVVKVQSIEDSSRASGSKDVDSETECPKYFTVPSDKLKDNMHRAIENVNVPEAKPEDFKKFKPSKSSKEYSETIERNEAKVAQSSKAPEHTTEAKAATSLHPSSKSTAAKAHESKAPPKGGGESKLTNLKTGDNNAKLTSQHNKAVMSAKSGVKLVESKEPSKGWKAAAFGPQTHSPQKIEPTKASTPTATVKSLISETKTANQKQTQSVKSTQTVETVKSSNTSTGDRAPGEEDSCVEEYMSDSNSTKMQEVKNLTDPSNYPAVHKQHHRKVRNDVLDVEDSKDFEGDGSNNAAPHNKHRKTKKDVSDVEDSKDFEDDGREDPSSYAANDKQNRKVKKDVSDVEGFKDFKDEADQLKRLQRDMYVINELQELLNTVREETKQEYDFDRSTRRKRQSDKTENHIGNFYNHQNSQYNRQLRHSKYNLVKNFRDGGKGKEKRFLFKKKRGRKKKKSQTIWKHLFGAHDDNRFLNQNFPNSQYAIYPI